MSSFSFLQLKNWLKRIDVKGKVLDIGGSVQTLEGRVNSFKPTEYKILDNEVEKGLRDKWTEPDIKWDINDPMSGNQWNERFDQIFMIEISEYIFDPITALKNVNQLLKRGGFLFFSTHFLYPQHPPIGLDYLRYTPAGVEKLLKETGFEILEYIPRRTEVIDLKAVWSAEKMRGWKEFDNSVIGSMVVARKKGEK